MKKITLYLAVIFMTIFISSCSQNDNANSQDIKVFQPSENFDWLLGSWIRTNEQADRKMFEIWEKKSNTEYFGIGFTMQNGDTVKQEAMKLTQENSTWNLLVKVPDETEWISFNVTKFGKEFFTCENKELDFPQMIKYWKNKDKINALVAGREISISFEFEKIEN
jgi:hypothetical protein